MCIECRTFVSKLSELLTIKRDLPKSTVTSWVRTKVSFALIEVRNSRLRKLSYKTELRKITSHFEFRVTNSETFIEILLSC